MDTGHTDVSARLKSRCLKLARALALLAAVWPVLAAIGWLLDVPPLTRLHPSLPAMQPNTVVFLLLAARSRARRG